MLIWLLYDIKNNKNRNKVFSICRNFGMFPIQKSVFLGIIDEDRKEIFLNNLKSNIDKQDSIIILQSTKNNVKNSILLGKEIDFDLALREKNLMFF